MSQLFYPPPPWLAYWNGENDPESESLIATWRSRDHYRHASLLWDQQHAGEMAKADEIKNEARRYRRKQELNSAKNQFIAARTTYHRFDPLVEKVHKINSLIGLDVTYIFRTFSTPDKRHALRPFHLFEISRAIDTLINSESNTDDPSSHSPSE